MNFRQLCAIYSKLSKLSAVTIAHFNSNSFPGNGSKTFLLAVLAMLFAANDIESSV